MIGLDLVFWSAVLCVLYPYAIYPVILAVQARLWPWPVARSVSGAGAGLPSPLPSVSVVVVAYNEEARIGARVSGLADQIRGLGLRGEIVVVSDGSTDKTVANAQAIDGQGVPIRVIGLSENVGKAAALSEGCLAASNKILALADTRQTWADDALARLLENYADPAVGAVSGELFVRDSGGAMAAVGLYWRFEKWLRRNESLVHSTAGLTGAISSVRRELFKPIPKGIMLDDVYWPLRVVMDRHRVIFDGRAHAFDRLPDDLRSEFRRKVRTLSGNFQLVAALPEVLLPWKNPVWFALISHKLMRLAVPWGAIVALAAGPFVGGLLPLAITLAGLAIIGLGLAGLNPRAASASRLAAAAASFLTLNFAAWLGFWVWASGRANRSWTKVVYRAESSTASMSTSTSATPLCSHESIKQVAL